MKILFKVFALLSIVLVIFCAVAVLFFPVYRLDRPEANRFSADNWVFTSRWYYYFYDMRDNDLIIVQPIDGIYETGKWVSNGADKRLASHKNSIHGKVLYSFSGP